MKPNTSHLTQNTKFARPVVGAHVIAALSAVALLTACGGGSSSSAGASTTGTDSTVSLATVSTGYTPTVVTATTTTPVTTSSSSATATTVGTVLTDVRLQNTGAAQTNMPFTFGQVFVAGALKPTEGLAAKLSDGTIVSLQVDVKATHADGSVRHAIISGVLPSLAASQTQTLQLAKSTASAKSTLTPQSLISAGLTGSINVTAGGVKYTASLADALATTATNWLSGGVANEWIVNAPLKDANGNAHPLLTARFDVRWYSGLSKQARVEFVVENDKTWVSGSRATYDVNLELGGKSVYSKAGLTQYHHSRWRQLAWWDASRQPAVNIQHNTAYLIATKAVPNFDQSFAPSETELSALASTINSSNTGPMTIGPVTAYMGMTGGRGDIGPLPSWSVMYLLSMDKRAKDVMLAAADGSGSWSVHYRDEKTDYPLRTDSVANSGISTHANLGWLGPLPVPRCANNDNTLCETAYGDDTAHQPSLVYLPYLVTGDYYYLEELQFWAASNPLATDPNNSGRGLGLVRWQQVRGQAWSLRTLGHVSYITPDAHPLKSYFTTQLDANLDFYNATYVVGNPNKLGAYDGSGQSSVEAPASAPWQDDFLTWSFGYLAELGFTKATPILQWKAQYPVGRMTAPGYCWIAGSPYTMKFRDSNGAVVDSFEKLYLLNYGGDYVYNDDAALIANPVGNKFSDLPCASQAQADWMTKAHRYTWVQNQMVGYAPSALGYPANMQPALAVAATSGIPNAAKAWSVFMGRAVKPDYKQAPQWAIIPR
jgi:hypothetical protein